MSLVLKHCINSRIGQITYYYSNSIWLCTAIASNGTQFIKYMPIPSPPFSYSWIDMPNLRNIPRDMVCGTFIKILQELSIKHGYG